jgi:hypothetical protein
VGRYDLAPRRNGAVSPVGGLATYRLTRAERRLAELELYTEMAVETVVDITEVAILETDHLVDVARSSANGDPAKLVKNALLVEDGILSVRRIVNRASRQVF